MLRGLPPARIYLLRAAVSAFSYGLIVNVLTTYYVREARLDALQLVLVGTVLEASYFVFEIPTGVLADTVGRKPSVVLGGLIIGAAFVGQALVPAFLAILAFEAIRGLGEAFASGAPEAWISSEVGDDEAGRIFLRASQVGRVSYAAGLLASIPLAAVTLIAPIVAGGLLAVAMSALLVRAMPERAFRPEGSPRSWSAFAATARDGLRVVRGRPLLLTILAVELCVGAASEGYDRLWEAHLLTDVGFPPLFGGDAVTWFALINIGSMAIGIAAVELVRRSRVDLTRHAIATRFLFASHALVIATRIVFALAPTFAVALGAKWTGALSAASGPVYTGWLTRNIEPSVRATVISTAGIFNAGGQIAGGPGVGFVGRVAGIPNAIAASSAILLPSLFLFARAEAQQPRTASEETPVPA